MVVVADAQAGGAADAYVAEKLAQAHRIQRFAVMPFFPGAIREAMEMLQQVNGVDFLNMSLRN